MPKMYELRVYRDNRPVRTVNQLVEALDWDDAEHTRDLLSRHLYAVAEREGVGRRQAHLFHLDIHEMRGDRVERHPKHQFSVPVVA